MKQNYKKKTKERRKQKVKKKAQKETVNSHTDTPHCLSHHTAWRVLGVGYNPAGNQPPTLTIPY